MQTLVENLHLELGGFQIGADFIGSEKTIGEVTDLPSACTEQLEITDDVRLESFDNPRANRLGTLFTMRPKRPCNPVVRNDHIERGQHPSG